MGNDSLIDRLRANMDEVNEALLDVLVSRQEVIEKITQWKIENGVDARQPARFAAMMDKIQASARARGLDTETIEAIFNLLHDSSIKKQRSKGVQ